MEIPCLMFPSHFLVHDNQLVVTVPAGYSVI